MICPACREEMIVVEYKQIELDFCTLCKGVWFDTDELELLLGSLNLKPGQLFQPLREKSAEEVRNCPYCRRKMEKVIVGNTIRNGVYAGGVMIDRCSKGHGLWFDGGELDTVIKGMQQPAALSSKAREEVGSFLKDVLFAGDNQTKKGDST